MVEGIAHRALDDAGGLLGGEPVLGLALERRPADEHREHRRRGSQNVVGRDLGSAPVADALAEVAQALGEGRAQAVLVRAALRRGNGVAVGIEEAVLVGDPAHRPFHRAVAAVVLDAAGEQVLGDSRLAVDGGLQVFLQPAGEMEGGFLRRIVGDQRFRARPADLHAAEQVGLRAGHAEQALRLEGGAFAEDFLVGPEAHARAAPVLDGPEVPELAQRRAAAELHAVELLAARHLHFEPLRECVDNRHADAVQAARGVVVLGTELAARVQRGHDHFEGGLGLELGVRIDRDAAAVVGDGEIAVGLQLHFDPGGVAGHRLVHGVVDHLGEQVMQGLLVGAANVHAGMAPHRLQALQDLDVGRSVALRCFGRLANGARHGFLSSSPLELV